MNILPQVEAALITSPYVENIMLHCDPFRSYCVALVVASEPALRDWAARQQISFNDFPELCEKDETIKEVLGSLIKVSIVNHCFTGTDEHKGFAD